MSSNLTDYSANQQFYQEFDATFWLLFAGSVFTFLGLCLRACLKSRCTEIKICGITIKRDLSVPEPDLEIPSFSLGGTKQQQPTSPK